MTGYATTLNNHSLAAMCLVFMLAPLLRILSDGSQRGLDFALVGFWSAMVCCQELPAALLGIAMFVMLVRTSVSQTAKWFVPAALIPLIAYFATNYLATGGWKPFYLYYGTEKYLYEIDGVKSYWHTPHGMDQNLDSPLTYFFHCLVGHHGIFSLSPIFLLAVVPAIRRSWLNASRLKPAVILGGLLTVIVLGFYLTRTDNYNYGGNTFGLRWMIWLTPFWVLAMVPTLERFATHRTGLVGLFSRIRGEESVGRVLAVSADGACRLDRLFRPAASVSVQSPSPDLVRDFARRKFGFCLDRVHGSWQQRQCGRHTI